MGDFGDWLGLLALLFTGVGLISAMERDAFLLRLPASFVLMFLSLILMP